MKYMFFFKLRLLLRHHNYDKTIEIENLRRSKVWSEVDSIFEQQSINPL